MIENTLQLLKDASYSLPLLEESQVTDALLSVADAIESHTDMLLKANADDLSRMDPASPLYDRLTTCLNGPSSD